jgi:hypothetical protein
MKTKLIFILLVMATLLNGATLQTDKEIYTPQEEIELTFSDMSGNALDWIAIYPAGSSTAWGNVITYHYTNGLVSDTETWQPLPVGNYELRAFFNNSFNLEATHAFSVEANVAEVTLTTNKDIYLPNEIITVDYANMSGNALDWIAIYPAGSSTAWGNVITYHYTNGLISDSETWQPLPVGDYEIRAFFNNSFNLEVSHAFSVEDDGVDEVTLTLNKNIYAQNELVYVNYENMAGNNTDWIGIYPAGASYEFENVIDWKYTKGNVNGEMALGGFPGDTDLSGSTPMPGLPAGDYEIRAFFNNSLTQQSMVSFTVTNQAVTSTIYEEANGAISANWIHVSGPYPHIYFNGVVRLRANWINNTTNLSEYTLPFDVPNTTDKVLELDVGGQGRWTPHFNVGVLVDTTNGTRRMLWDSFLNHYNVKANKQGNVLSFPTYVELQQNTANNQKHLRVNIDKYLKILEPNNKLIRVRAFFATGGDLDNIKLSSH